MMRNTLISAAIAVTAVPLYAQDAAMVGESRKAAGQLVSQLQKALQEEMRNGPDGAIGVCKNLAPAKASEISRSTGWKVTRVSLKTRNPLLGTPDAWEAAKLQELEKRLAAGEDPATIETSEVVKEGDREYFRYMKGIPIQPTCLPCHGPNDAIPPGVKAKLKAEYPYDKAVGYGVGQLRGGLSVKRPL